MSLYQDLLGPKFGRLPPVVRRMHDVTGEVHAVGTGSVERGRNPLSRLLAMLLRMPRPGTWVPVSIVFRQGRGGEWLIRDYDGRVLVTRQDAGAGADAGMLLERFGPVSLVISLDLEDDALAFTLKSARLVGLPLPRTLWPRITAYESAVDGWYVSYVDIGLPLIGRLIRYCCRIRPQPGGSDCRSADHAVDR